MVVRTIVVAVLGVAVRVSMVGRALGLAHVQPEAAECVAQLAQRCEEGRVEVEGDVCAGGARLERAALLRCVLVGVAAHVRLKQRVLVLVLVVRDYPHGVDERCTADEACGEVDEVVEGVRARGLRGDEQSANEEGRSAKRAQRRLDRSHRTWEGEGARLTGDGEGRLRGRRRRRRRGRGRDRAERTSDDLVDVELLELYVGEVEAIEAEAGDDD